MLCAASCQVVVARITCTRKALWVLGRATDRFSELDRSMTVVGQRPARETRDSPVVNFFVTEGSQQTRVQLFEEFLVFRLKVVLPVARLALPVMARQIFLALFSPGGLGLESVSPGGHH